MLRDLFLSVSVPSHVYNHALVGVGRTAGHNRRTLSEPIREDCHEVIASRH